MVLIGFDAEHHTIYDLFRWIEKHSFLANFHEGPLWAALVFFGALFSISLPIWLFDLNTVFFSEIATTTRYHR